MGRLDWGFQPSSNPPPHGRTAAASAKPRDVHPREALPPRSAETGLPTFALSRITSNAELRSSATQEHDSADAEPAAANIETSRVATIPDSFVDPFHPNDPFPVAPFGLVHGRTITPGAHRPGHELLSNSAGPDHLRAWATPPRARLQPDRKRLRCRLRHCTCTPSCTTSRCTSDTT